jgi:hypothetical protein
LLQLDELGTAVLSPIGASIKEEKQALGSGEIGERPRNAFLVWKGEIGDALARLRSRSVAIIGGVNVPGVQLGWNGLSGGTKPSELPHDRGFFGEIFRYVDCHRYPLSPIHDDHYTTARVVAVALIEQILLWGFANKIRRVVNAAGTFVSGNLRIGAYWTRAIHDAIGVMRCEDLGGRLPFLKPLR